MNDYYNPDILEATDYYPFVMVARNTSLVIPYTRFGFNGKEFDWEVKGWMNQQDYGFRIYDPRIGRFLSEDPLTKGYPELTPYQFASNRPIEGIDWDGLEFRRPTFGTSGWARSPIVRGTKDGVVSSLKKTWNFIRRDAWRAETWENIGLTIEEAAISMPAQSHKIYKPATPRLDAMVEDLDKNLIHGDAYSRSKYLSEFGTSMLTGYAFQSLQSLWARLSGMPEQFRRSFCILISEDMEDIKMQ